MKSVFFTALFITLAKGYVDSELAYTYAATCISCTDASDCESEYSGIISYTFQCVNDTCMTRACESDSECSDGQDCFEISCCGTTEETISALSSSICLDEDTCDYMDDLNNTMNATCVEGADEEIYTSDEDAAVCGNTCSITQDVDCFETPSPTKEDKEGNGGSSAIWESCSGDFKFAGCLEVLFTDGLWYAIGVIALICLCCCGFVVLCMRKKKGGTDQYEMDNQTNHYNVYI